MGDKMNRRENKIFSELIWNDKSTVAAFKDKYNVQERSIRLAIKRSYGSWITNNL